MTSATTVSPRTIGATEHTHMLIAGDPGSGKTALAQAIVHDAVAAGASVTVVDPYGPRSYTFLDGLAPEPSTTLHGAVESLRGACNEMNRRQAQMAKAGVATFAELDEPPAPMLVLLEEPAAWHSETVRNLTHRLVSEGRSSGINVIVVVQDPSQISAALRSGLGTRVLMGSAHGLHRRQVLRNPDAGARPASICPAGTGVFETAGDLAVEFRGPCESQDTYRASLAAL